MSTELMYVPTGTSNELLIIDLNEDKIIGRIGGARKCASDGNT